MIVDDDIAVCALFQAALTLDNHETTTFSNGEDALAFLLSPGAARPQLIITDVMMPKLDGFTFQQRLRENERTRRVPIIVVSAKPNLKDAFSQESNVAGFLEKPCRIDEFRKAVANVLARRPA